MKRSIVLGATLLLAALTFSGCKKEDPADAATSNSLVVYNWGEYIDPDVLDEFEEETGISIIYVNLRPTRSCTLKWKPALSSTMSSVPSDYMVQKMIENDLLEPLDLRQNPEYFQHRSGLSEIRRAV